ncbi:hypothetical protein [Virgisporangium ochraceum]|nr:hypothetical protein [Virgisporangium ochraceum]
MDLDLTTGPDGMPTSRASVAVMEIRKGPRPFGSVSLKGTLARVWAQAPAIALLFTMFFKGEEVLALLGAIAVVMSVGLNRPTSSRQGKADPRR